MAQRVEKLTAKAVKSNHCCGQIVTLQVSNFQEASRKFDEAARPIDPNSLEAQAKVAAAMRKMEEDLAKISEQYSLKNKLLGYANTAVEAFKETFTNAAGTARGIGGSVVNFGPDVVNLFGEVGRYGAGGMYLIAGGLADAAGRAAGYGTGGGDQAFASAQEYFNNPQLVPWRLDPLYKPQEGIEQFWYTMSPMNWWPAAGGRTVGGRVAINTAEGVLNVTPSTLNQINGILATSKTPAQAVKNLDTAIEVARKAGASPGDIAALEQTRVGLATGKIKPTGNKSTDGVAINSGPRTFKSADPLVGDLATKIEATYPGSVADVNVPIRDSTGKLVTDADILMKDGTVIQVKSGGGKGLTSQLQRTQDAIGSANVFGYGPTIKPSVINSANEAGFKVFTSEAELIRQLKPKI